MGAGAPVLLLHGQPGSARDWDYVRRALGDRVRSIAIDRPGWSASGDPATDLDGNARAALDALDRAGMERATLVGHSFGGGVAAWTAAYHPERVSSLVLLAPSANAASLYLLDRLLATAGVGEVASAVTLGGAGVALEAAAWVRRVALGDGGGYLHQSGRRMLAPSAWRTFTVRAAGARPRPAAARPRPRTDPGADDDRVGDERPRRAAVGPAGARGSDPRRAARGDPARRASAAAAPGAEGR